VRAWLWGIAAAALVAAIAFSRRASAAELDELPEGRVVTEGGERQPRGIRNLNPFNLRPDRRWTWRGQAGVDDARPGGPYLVFHTPADGLRAGFINLANQQRKHGLDTVREIITKYAPAADDNDTEAYIAAVARAIGKDADAHLDLVGGDGQLAAFGRAVIRHENGVQPYSDAQLAFAEREAREAIS
jgi:hypothetical protein